MNGCMHACARRPIGRAANRSGRELAESFARREMRTKQSVRATKEAAVNEGRDRRR